MKIDLVLTVAPCNDCKEVERPPLAYGRFDENNITEKVDRCATYFNLGGDVHLFCYSVLLSSWAKAVLASIKNVKF